MLLAYNVLILTIEVPSRKVLRDSQPRLKEKTVTPQQNLSISSLIGEGRLGGSVGTLGKPF